jgi:hypothetical protein
MQQVPLDEQQRLLLAETLPSASQELETSAPGAATVADYSAQQTRVDTTTPDKSQPRAAERTAPVDARAERRPSTSDRDTEVRKVLLSEVDGIDEEIEEFLRENDISSDVWIRLESWSPEMRRSALMHTHLVLWAKRGRLVALGTGKSLTLAGRLARHDDALPATIVQAKSLSLQQKLVYVAHELLFLPALHRTPAGYSATATALATALTKAGVATLKRPTLRDFVNATGLSMAALKRHWPANPGTP